MTMSLAYLSLSSKTLLSLQQAGIHTLDDIIALDPSQLRQFYGIKSTAHAVHALARAFVENRGVCFAPLAPECQQVGWFFDIETSPYSGNVWSIGWSAGDGHTHIAIVASVISQHMLALRHDMTVYLVEDSEEAWRVFAQKTAVNAHPIFHWTSFDAGVMQKFAPRDAKEQLEGRLLDLHRLFKQSVRFPSASLPLKPTASFLGFRWSAYDDWQQAWFDYGRYIQSGTIDYLVQACTYQRDDVIAMEVVHDWLNKNAMP